MLRDTDMEAGAAEHIQWLQCTFGGLLSFKPCKTLETQSKTAIPPWLGFLEQSVQLHAVDGFWLSHSRSHTEMFTAQKSACCECPCGCAGTQPGELLHCPCQIPQPGWDVLRCGCTQIPLRLIAWLPLPACCDYQPGCTCVFQHQHAGWFC